MKTMNPQIMNLSREEFDKLIFMVNPHEWEDHPHDPSHKFLLGICYKQLKDVVQKVINESENGAKSAVEVFNGLRHIRVKGEERPWFERHLILAENFDKALMTRLCIRNRTDGGKEQDSGGISIYRMATTAPLFTLFVSNVAKKNMMM